MIDVETLEQRLSEAEKAYHDLAMGKAARVIVDQSGERIEFSATTMTRLQVYITDLKRQLGLLSMTGPMRVSL